VTDYFENIVIYWIEDLLVGYKISILKNKGCIYYNVMLVRNSYKVNIAGVEPPNYISKQLSNSLNLRNRKSPLHIL
jgi:hypothetical protein